MNTNKLKFYKTYNPTRVNYIWLMNFLKNCFLVVSIYSKIIRGRSNFEINFLQKHNKIV